MKQIFLILLAFVAFAAYGQIPGNPDANGTITPGPPDFVTGQPVNPGVLELQLDYLNDRGDSVKAVFDYEIGYSNPDSVSAALIKADSAVIVVLDYDPPHGAMNFADSATVIGLTQNVWAKLTGPDGDLFVVRDQGDLTIAGDSITIAIPGDYMLWISLSFDGIQSAVFHVAIYKNGVVTDWEMHRKTAAQDTGNMGMPTYLKDLVAGDDISIWIENTGNSGDATMISGQVVITMLHPD